MSRLLFAYLRNSFLFALLFHLTCICAKQKHLGNWFTEVANIIDDGILLGDQTILKLKSMEGEAPSSKIELLNSNLAIMKCAKSLLKSQDAEFKRILSAQYLHEEQKVAIKILDRFDAYMIKLKSFYFVDAKNCPTPDDEVVKFKSKNIKSKTTNSKNLKSKTTKSKNTKSKTTNSKPIETKQEPFTTGHDLTLKDWIIISIVLMILVSLSVYLSWCDDPGTKNYFFSRKSTKNPELEPKKRINRNYSRKRTINSRSNRNKNSDSNSTQLNENNSSEIASSSDDLQQNNLPISNININNQKSRRRCNRNRNLRTENNNIFDDLQTITIPEDDSVNENLNTQQLNIEKNHKVNQRKTASISMIELELEKILECSICLEQLKNPKIMPCQHSLCKDCMEKLPRNIHGKQLHVECPICRKENYIPKNGFPNNYVFQSLLDDKEQNLEKMLECPICLEQLKNPKMLPCQHSFCMENCMKKLQKHRHGKQFHVNCPICRKENYIPKNGFPNNYVLQSLLDIQNKI